MRRWLILLGCILLLVQPVLAQEPLVALRIRVELVASEPDVDWDAAQGVIEQRVNGLGLLNYTVEQGDNRLIITTEAMMEFDEALSLSQRLIDVLGPITLLEFVDVQSSPINRMLEGSCVQTTGQLERGIVSDDCQLQPSGEPFLTVISGDDLETVEANLVDGRWQINFEIADDASEVFAAFTQSHIGSSLAIVLDGQVLSVPIINARIDGFGVIAGDFTEEETKTLAIQLQSGSLPVGLEVQSVLIHRSQ
ncbi:MAG: hypothetical protein H6673_01495 [Anaerolineales bacterium]|nr:hypothetical protein [Anaerolineales bacterium]